MTERVVYILEVVEIDIEDGGGIGAAAHFVDHRLQPFAEENTIGQTAERIVHGEMAQPALADGDGGRGTAHIAQHESCQQSKAGEGDGDEGHHIMDDFSARLFRRPGKLRNRFVAGRGQTIGGIGVGCRSFAEFVQICQAQSPGDTGERAAVDVFHRHQDRRFGIEPGGAAVERSDRGGGNHRRLAHVPANDDGAGASAGLVNAGGVEPQGVGNAQAPAPHIAKDIVERGLCLFEPGRFDGLVAT